MCAGLVPQQPPTSETPKSRTNWATVAAKGLGSSGKTVLLPSRTGIPALGRQETGRELA